MGCNAIFACGLFAAGRQQRHADGHAPTVSRQGLHLSLVQPNCAIRNGKSDAESPRIGAARIIYAIKRAEDSLKLICGIAGPRSLTSISTCQVSY